MPRKGVAADFIVLVASLAEQAGGKPVHVCSLCVLRERLLSGLVQAGKGRVVFNLQADRPPANLTLCFSPHASESCILLNINFGQTQLFCQECLNAVFLELVCTALGRVPAFDLPCRS